MNDYLRESFSYFGLYRKMFQVKEYAFLVHCRHVFGNEKREQGAGYVFLVDRWTIRNKGQGQVKASNSV